MRFVDWGQVDYKQAVHDQLELVNSVKESKEDICVFCTHPPVVTLGRATQAGDVAGWRGTVEETSRGGRATYHGPSQLVVYPIIDLSVEDRIHLKPRDVHSYLRSLESAVVLALHELDIPAQTMEPTTDAELDKIFTGVWVENRKIASIGIAVKKWVTYHGVAINLYEDEKAFTGITPCGFSSQVMTSIAKEIGHHDRDQLKSLLTKHLGAVFA